MKSIRAFIKRVPLKSHTLKGLLSRSPVLFRGLAIVPIVAACYSLRNAVALSVVMAFVLLPTVVLLSSVRGVCVLSARLAGGHIPCPRGGRSAGDLSAAGTRRYAATVQCGGCRILQTSADYRTGKHLGLDWLCPGGVVDWIREGDHRIGDPVGQSDSLSADHDDRGFARWRFYRIGLACRWLAALWPSGPVSLHSLYRASRWCQAETPP